MTRNSKNIISTTTIRVTQSAMLHQIKIGCAPLALTRAYESRHLLIESLKVKIRYKIPELVGRGSVQLRTESPPDQLQIIPSAVLLRGPNSRVPGSCSGYDILVES